MKAPLARHIPRLAEILGERPTRLYERMRELVREGLLEPVPGLTRGPAAVPASPRTIATLVIGMLASVDLAGSGRRARVTVEAMDGTFKRRFVDALTTILTNTAAAERVRLISVQTDIGMAVIHYEHGDSTPFVGGMPPAERPLAITIALKRDTIRALAAVVRDMTASNREKQ